jgi:hypothetical protein
MRSRPRSGLSRSVSLPRRSRTRRRCRGTRWRRPTRAWAEHTTLAGNVPAASTRGRCLQGVGPPLALADAGRNDVPVIGLRFRCTKCGSRRTDSVVIARPAYRAQPWRERPVPYPCQGNSESRRLAGRPLVRVSEVWEEPCAPSATFAWKACQPISARDGRAALRQRWTCAIEDLTVR